ncbi:MAG TPA: sugar ABC transporter substrate-binding protein [Elusimicrobiales bacterium]|nr:sugar ABC transporter substrate-binding protein [Elusimicrobiales bacterium]
MKKTNIFIAGLTLLLLCGCAKEQPQKSIKIGLSIPTQREERWVRDLAQLRKEAAALGVELLVEVSNNDSARQLVQCDNLLAQNITVLILAPHDATAAAAIVQKAHAQGVKVISYDRLILNADVDLYVSFDNVKVGEIQGRYISRLVPRGNYVVLAGAPTDNNATLFRQGAMNILRPLAERGYIQIIMDQAVKDWEPSEAMKLMEKALAANNGDIQAVLAPNDGTAGGVIQTLNRYKLTGLVQVTGQDAEAAAARRIVEGSQAMTVFKDTRQLAAAAFGAAMNFASGGDAPVNASVPNGKIDVPSLLLIPVAVDRTNIGKVLVESGYLTREEVYGPAPRQ